MGKAIAKVEFTFNTNTDDEDKVFKCIESQIVTDLNAYYQNDDNTAQMTGINLKVEVYKGDIKYRNGKNGLGKTIRE